MTDQQHTEAGLFSVVGERRVRGLLVPYDEASRVNVSGTPPISFARGTVALPRDPSVVGLNLNHDRYSPVGRAVAFEDTDRGVVADFEIADTDEGDAYLAQPSARKLSPELAGMVREGERGTAARITGAAIVTEGAFASAGLFALGDVTEAEPVDAAATTDGEHIAVEADSLPIDVTVTAADESATYVRAAEDDSEDDAPENPDAAFAASATEPAAPANPEEDAVTAATAQGFAAAQPTSAAASGLPDSRGLFAAIAEARSSGDLSPLHDIQRAQHQGMFELEDVAYDANGAQPTTAGDLGRPGIIVHRDYIGELWQGNKQERLYIPHLDRAPLTQLEWQAWLWDTKPEVAAWAGNKADIHSVVPKIKATTGKAQRFAGGNDIAREHYDFNNTEAIQAYITALIEDYALKSDRYALAQVKAGATTLALPATGDEPPTGINDAHYKIVRGALAVVAARAVPTFAFVSMADFAQVAMTPKDKTFEYLTFSAGLESATAAGFSIVPSPDLAAGEVLVGASRAATVRELPGSPIRVNALDIARGGVDEAVFGYTGVQVNYAPALQLVTRAAA